MHKNRKPMAAAVLSAKALELRARGLLNSKHELLLYGVIGNWWEGMDALTIVRELEAIDTPEIVVRIHSQGGYITEGLAMYNALKNASKPVHVYIDGICCSMATVVAMAASPGHLYTPDNALWMIHKPWGGVDGNAHKLREYADTLDVLEESMIAAYVAGGRVTVERVREILATGRDHFMTGAEAVVEGFADKLLDSVKAAASIDLSTLPEPQGSHKSLYEFYAVNAAQTTPRNHEETRMNKLQKLLAMKAALIAKGVATTAIDAAIAKAMGVAETQLPALLVEGSAATEIQLQAGLDALAQLEPAPAPAPAPGLPANASAQQVAQAAIAAERTRQSGINALAARHGLPNDQRDRLINSDTTVEQARAVVLDYLAQQDGRRQPAPGIVMTDTTGELFRASMANAMLNRMQPGVFKLEEGGREFRGMSLLEMAAACLSRAGHNVRGLTKPDLAAMALNTTSDFPNIVADVANKVLVKAYETQTRTFLKIATLTTFTDFKLKNAVEIGGGSDLEEVLENGEFKQGKVSEGKLSYKLGTYGKIFNFSRQLLINDDIGAFTQFIANIGSLAARKESSLVYTLIKAGAIFSTDNGNLVTGGGAIGSTQLDKNRKLMRKMKGLDGEPINVAGRYLLCSSDRETEAGQALTAILATQTSNVNIFQGSLEPIIEPLLDGVANDPWYTFADPAVVPCLEYGYLDGQTGPYIETKQGFEVDGIAIKVRHDFGAGWVSKRGAVKNPGA